MRSFIAEAIGAAAAMFGLLGATAILMAAAFLGLAYHWACFGLLLLLPLWIAATSKIMDWSWDFEHRA